MAKLSAHPPLMPYVRPEELPASLPDRAKVVYGVLFAHAMASSDAAAVWEVRRHGFTLGGQRFVSYHQELVEPGWRNHLPSAPRPDAFRWAEKAVEDDPAPGTTSVVEAVSRVETSEPWQLADVLLKMAEHEIGTPSSYAKLLQWLIDSELISHRRFPLPLSEKGAKKHSELVGSDGAGSVLTRHRREEELLQRIEEGIESAKAVLVGEYGEGLQTIGDEVDRILGHEEHRSATEVYAERDRLYDERVDWDGHLLPAAVDPERQIPPDSEIRQVRSGLTKRAIEASGDAWRAMNADDRSLVRIEILSQGNRSEWMERNRFNLESRWLVGWLCASDRYRD